jgi:hypothetical protein
MSSLVTSFELHILSFALSADEIFIVLKNFLMLYSAYFAPSQILSIS